MRLIESCIRPDWPAPANVVALQTTRLGGASKAPYDSLNLGDHVGDSPLVVTRNRMALESLLPSEPVWLKQVHGIEIVQTATAGCLPTGDAAIARDVGSVCVVMTADCLPVLLCDEAGTVVAAVHAGWRGLCDGVIEHTIAAMGVAPERLMAWLGPAIGPQAFGVGAEVKAAFVAKQPEAAQAFTPGAEGKWYADIWQLARQRLASVGVTHIYGGGLCTYSDPQRFFSYRRDGVTGRMGTFIWLS